MKYNHKTNIQRSKRRLKRTKRTLVIALVVSVLIGLGLLWYALQYAWNETAAKESPVVDKGFYAGSQTTTYDNGKFSFTSAKNWELEERASKIPEKYVYVSRRGQNAQYLWTIYFDNIPDLPTKYILPIRIVNNRLNTGAVSPKCGDEKDTRVTSAPTGATVATAVYDGLEYTCKIEGFENIVAPVYDQGGYVLPIADSNGQVVKVGMIFQDLGINLQLDPIKEVINSFNVK